MWRVSTRTARLGALVAFAIVVASCSGNEATVEPAPADPPPVDTEAAVETTTAPTSSVIPPATAVGRPPSRDELVPFPAHPPGTPWPTDSWPVGELPAGADGDAIEALLERTFEGAAFGQIDAVLLVLNGELVIERYADGYDSDTVHPGHSISTSVAHALAGRLVRAGRLDVEEPVGIDEWAEDERAAITPEMLLRMTTGLRWVESVDSRADVSGDPPGGAAAVLVERELVAEPGTVFEYSTGAAGLLGRLMRDLVGDPPAFDEWARAELFDRIGIRSATLGYGADGAWLAGSQVQMTARDFARLGYLYLRGGEWDGETVLDPEWVDDARTVTPPSDGYGAGWWVFSNDTFAAQGTRGQVIWVLPVHGDVLVVLSDNDAPARTWQLIRRLAILLPSERGSGS